MRPNLLTNHTPLTRWATAAALLLACRLSEAQGFEKLNTTVTNVNAILVLVSISVVAIAIIWAGYKMIFQSARLSDVANILIGGTLIGGATAMATFIVA